MNAVVELYHTLADAWRAADLAERLRAWWWATQTDANVSVAAEMLL